MPIKMSSSFFSLFHHDIQLKTILSHDHDFQLGSHCSNEVVKDAPKFHGKGMLCLCYRGTTYEKTHSHSAFDKGTTIHNYAMCKLLFKFNESFN